MSARLRRACRILAFAALLACSAARASGQTITEFPLPAGSLPGSITSGPGGSLWFTDTGGGGRIGRITPAGAVTLFPVPLCPFPVPPGGGNGPLDIVAGPDGGVWFTQICGNHGLSIAGAIGRVSPDGVVTLFPFLERRFPSRIASGPDGNLWFTEFETSSNRVSRITPDGVVTDFPLPAHPSDLASGHDQNLWFTLADSIARMTTDGAVTEFSIPTASGAPGAITPGPDGNLWFLKPAVNRIGRITTAGVVAEYPIPTASSGAIDIASGPEGNVWFTERDANRIGRITTSGVVTEIPIPTPASTPIGITAGPDGNVWFTELSAGKIARITPAAVPTATRILPVVGSTPGANGTFFRTSVQLHNPGTTPATGRIVFHPSGESGSAWDPALPYALAAGQTLFLPDLLPALGRSGLGSADLEVASGSVPVAVVRVFNDAGAAGTSGFTEELVAPEEALSNGKPGILLLPADRTAYRFNVGIRTFGTIVLIAASLYDSSGTLVTQVLLGLPPVFHLQQSVTDFFRWSDIPANGSVSISVHGADHRAIVYGATVDNTTGDPSLQIARAES